MRPRIRGTSGAEFAEYGRTPRTRAGLQDGVRAKRTEMRETPGSLILLRIVWSYYASKWGDVTRIFALEKYERARELRIKLSVNLVATTWTLSAQNAPRCLGAERDDPGRNRQGRSE